MNLLRKICVFGSIILFSSYLILVSCDPDLDLGAKKEQKTVTLDHLPPSPIDTPVKTDPNPQLGRLPFCPPSSGLNPNNPSRNSNVLIVSTLDGQIHALNSDPELGHRVLWSVATEPGDMVSSTISQLELTNNAKWVKLIPSLGGGLYKFDGETIEAVPLSAETLLKTSFKFADNTIFTGGKESRTYGIEMDSGRIR